MSCAANTDEGQAECESCPDFWIIGEDISEDEAKNLRVPIRPGPNGTQYVWVGDMNPE